MQLTRRLPPRLRAQLRARLPAGVYAALRTRRIRRYVEGFTPTTIARDYAGFPLTLELRDPLARGWYDRDWDEPAEITELRAGRLRPGARVFDAGAHQGVVALILARIVGDAGAVLAIEAERHNAAAARRNAALNGADNLTVIHAAAAARSGSLSFAESLNGFVTDSARLGTVSVPAISLDELARRHGTPDVILIDVEGYEAQVIDGAAELLRGRRTDFCIEVHDPEMLHRAGRVQADVLLPFLEAGYGVRMAVTGDTPPGIADAMSGGWREVTSAAQAPGCRFFLIARPGGSA